MTIIVMGMVIPVFAGSPEKKPGDKTKTDNLSPSPLSLLTTWDLYIVVTDANDTCYDYEYGNCDLYFHIESETADCDGSITNPPPFDVPITWGNRNYGAFPISTDVPCVKITIISKKSPTPCTNFNHTPCCACPHGQPPSATCYMRICP